MTAFFKGDRLYHMFSANPHEGTDTNRFKIKLIKTAYGLLIENSSSNLKLINNVKIKTGEVRSMIPFFIFNSTYDSVSFVTPISGAKFRSIIVRRSELDGKSLSGTGEINLFISIMLEQKKTPREIYEAMARTMYVGSGVKEFMANADGLCVNELFNHPFAKADEVF